MKITVSDWAGLALAVVILVAWAMGRRVHL